VYFSSSSHGLVCRDCEASFADKVRLEKFGVQALACLSAGAGLVPAQRGLPLQHIEKILIYHFTNLLHRPPRMAGYFA
jgi:hypothetical protein